jgi:hypothetical protein
MAAFGRRGFWRTDMSEPITFKLKHPIDIRNKETGAIIETITEFTLHRPKGKVLKAVDKVTGEGSAALAVFAAIAGVPPSVMDEIDMEDLAELQEVGAPFLASFQRMAGKY